MSKFNSDRKGQTEQIEKILYSEEQEVLTGETYDNLTGINSEEMITFKLIMGKNEDTTILSLKQQQLSSGRTILFI